MVSGFPALIALDIELRIGVFSACHEMDDEDVVERCSTVCMGNDRHEVDNAKSPTNRAILVHFRWHKFQFAYIELHSSHASRAPYVDDTMISSRTMNAWPLSTDFRASIAP